VSRSNADGDPARRTLSAVSGLSASGNARGGFSGPSESKVETNTDRTFVQRNSFAEGHSYSRSRDRHSQSLKLLRPVVLGPEIAASDRSQPSPMESSGIPLNGPRSETFRATVAIRRNLHA
jgi:hypothetical protein